MNFSKTTSYSLSVLNYMSEHPDKLYSANFLQEELDIPHQYLRHLLTSLSKSGFLKGSRGREGGFMLSKPTDEIFLADIIDSTEGLDVFNTCIMGFKECPFENTCTMHETWVDTRERIIDILKTTSLADFREKKE